MGDLYSKGQLLHAVAVHGLLSRRAEAAQVESAERLTLENIVNGADAKFDNGSATIAMDEGRHHGRAVLLASLCSFCMCCASG